MDEMVGMTVWVVTCGFHDALTKDVTVVVFDNEADAKMNMAAVEAIFIPTGGFAYMQESIITSYAHRARTQGEDGGIW